MCNDLNNNDNNDFEIFDFDKREVQCVYDFYKIFVDVVDFMVSYVVLLLIEMCLMNIEMCVQRKLNLNQIC